MSAARLLLILAILQGETNADKALTLHQIHDKLLRLHPEEDCTEQRIRGDLSVLEGLSEEGALSVRVESSVGESLSEPPAEKVFDLPAGRVSFGAGSSTTSAAGADPTLSDAERKSAPDAAGALSSP